MMGTLLCRPGRWGRDRADADQRQRFPRHPDQQELGGSQEGPKDAHATPAQDPDARTGEFHHENTRALAESGPDVLRLNFSDGSHVNHEPRYAITPDIPAMSRSRQFDMWSKLRCRSIPLMASSQNFPSQANIGLLPPQSSSATSV